jgi:hypothetical protein
MNIPKGLKAYFENELKTSSQQLAEGNLANAWNHLERVHILGQAWPIEHTKSHWRMLGFAFRIKDTKEIIGQLPRLLVGGVKSFVGEIPTGNTGGADVPPLRTMEIPEDLSEILRKYK